MNALFLAGMALLSTATGAAPDQADDLADSVGGAIRAGLSYLRSQERDGRWGSEIGLQVYPGGETALALLALLEAGATADDPMVKRGLEYLRTVLPDQTYVVALQTMVFARAGMAVDRERIQRNADWLCSAHLPDGWTYKKLERQGLADNSNTHYAVLALEAALRAGARVEPKVLQDTRDFLQRSQDRSGGWWYRPNSPPTMSMTAACLDGLFLGSREVDRRRLKPREDGSTLDCGAYPDERETVRALDWLGSHLSDRLTDKSFTGPLRSPYYTLHTLGCAGKRTGYRFFGAHDWYEAGARYLLAAQQADGSWQATEGALDRWPIVATSFALLFLIEGRTAVLVAKLAYGPDGGGNTKRFDLANLVDFTSRQLYRGQRLAWQVFDVRHRGDLDAASCRLLARKLREAPVAFFNGHDAAPRGNEEKILREYLAGGGLVFAEACCGDLRFDRDFRALMKRLFPDTPLRPLPADHPLWRVGGKWQVSPKTYPLESIEKGGRQVVVYSPKPLAGYWEADERERGREAFRIGAAVLAYATGLKAPPPRGRGVPVDSPRSP
jgi:hypothetical protein